MIRKIVCIITIANLGFSYAFAKEVVVAEVNGKKIYRNDLKKEYKENKLFLGTKATSIEGVLDHMINRELGIQKAKEGKLDKDPIVVEKMNDILYHAQISKDLEPELKKIKVTEKDMRDYYKDHKEYRTAHILHRLPAEPTKEQIDNGLVLMLDLYQKLVKNPESFAEMANKHSQSINSQNGGDMGFQPAPRLPPEYYAEIKGKSPGHITKPIQSQFGFHIIKVLGVKDYKEINKGLYRKLVYDMKRDEILQEYFKKLKKGSKIKIFRDNF